MGGLYPLPSLSLNHSPSLDLSFPLPLNIELLLLTGLLYESCVEFCQEKATKAGSQDTLMIKSELLETGGLSDTDLSLLSWLQALPKDSFATPFEQKSLSLDFLQVQFITCMRINIIMNACSLIYYLDY